MTETISAAEASVDAPSRRRLLRTAGWGGIAALAFWVLQPILVFLVVGDKVSQPTWQYFHDFPFNGMYEAVTFGGVAFGVLVTVLAVDRLVRSTEEPSLWWSLATWCGLIAGTMWIMTAGITLVPFTSVGNAVRTLIPDIADQNVVFEAWAFVVTGLLMAYMLAAAAWLVILGVVGRRRGLFGWPSAILVLVGAAATFTPVFIPFAPPIGGMTALATMAVLGVVLLVKARRA